MSLEDLFDIKKTCYYHIQSVEHPLGKTLKKDEMIKYAKEQLKINKKVHGIDKEIETKDLDDEINAWVYLRNIGLGVKTTCEIPTIEEIEKKTGMSRKTMAEIIKYAKEHRGKIPAHTMFAEWEKEQQEIEGKLAGTGYFEDKKKALKEQIDDLIQGKVTPADIGLEEFSREKAISLLKEELEEVE